MESVKVRGMLVFKIAVGNLSEEKASAYIKTMMAKYRRGRTYDAVTGQANEVPGEIPDDISMIFLPISGASNSEIQYISFDGTDFTTEQIEELLKSDKEQLINVRITKVEKARMLDKAKKAGFKTLSEYLRFVGLNATLEVKA